MLLSNNQAEQRLGSPRNLANRFGSSAPTFITVHRPGRKADTPNMDKIKQNEIALRSRLGEKQGALAQEFNTTQARVSQLERGKSNSLDEEKLHEQLSKARDVAVDKLLTSMGLITSEKLNKENAQGLSRIAANMARVVEKTLPKESSDNNVQVIVYCPEQRSESSFKIVEV